MSIRTSLSVGLAAFAVTTFPAYGQSRPIVVEGSLPVAVVSYADLDLSDPAGLDRLNHRVRRAAQSLCLNPGVTGIWFRMEERRCLTGALADAQPQVQRAVALAGNPQYAGRAEITVAGR